jgi:hypothetical protein
MCCIENDPFSLTIIENEKAIENELMMGYNLLLMRTIIAMSSTLISFCHLSVCMEIKDR